MSQSTRYIINQSSRPAQVDAHTELLAALTAMVIQCSPYRTPPGGWRYSGLYAGPTSASYLFFRLSEIYPALKVDGKTMHEWSAAYLDEPALRGGPTRSSLDSSHCGIAQETLAHAAVMAVVKQDVSYITKFCESVERLLDEGGSNEWLYGRAGYLYLLRVMKRGFPGNDGVETLTSEITEKVIDHILQTPRPWTWHHKQYLGAAHGAIGIITQIVLSRPSRAADLQRMLEEILDSQFQSGNFPSSIPVGNDRLVQFCHGAAGLALSLQAISPYFPRIRTRIERALKLARDCVWERGLLTKEPCLCHGISGNALVFEEADKLRHFLSFSTQEQLERRWRTPPLDAAVENQSMTALFTGGAGRAWAWAVADKDLPRTCIGYNDV
ncbi:MAG: hypothetical protein M1837_002693 [Sclerophora amabilis]|nr:MAG: hypothetical protein M1837_002693 [Sclerophora amabilis]